QRLLGHELFGLVVFATTAKSVQLLPRAGGRRMEPFHERRTFARRCRVAAALLGAGVVVAPVAAVMPPGRIVVLAEALVVSVGLVLTRVVRVMMGLVLVLALAVALGVVRLLLVHDSSPGRSTRNAESPAFGLAPALRGPGIGRRAR